MEGNLEARQSLPLEECPLHRLDYVIRAILPRHQTLAHFAQDSPRPCPSSAPQLQLTSWKVCMVTMISLVSAEQSSFSLATKRRRSR